MTIHSYQLALRRDNPDYFVNSDLASLQEETEQIFATRDISGILFRFITLSKLQCLQAYLGRLPAKQVVESILNADNNLFPAVLLIGGGKHNVRSQIIEFLLSLLNKKQIEELLALDFRMPVVTAYPKIFYRAAQHDPNAFLDNYVEEGTKSKFIVIHPETTDTYLASSNTPISIRFNGLIASALYWESGFYMKLVETLTRKERNNLLCQPSIESYKYLISCSNNYEFTFDLLESCTKQYGNETLDDLLFSIQNSEFFKSNMNFLSAKKPIYDYMLNEYRKRNITFHPLLWSNIIFGKYSGEDSDFYSWLGEDFTIQERLWMLLSTHHKDLYQISSTPSYCLPWDFYNNHKLLFNLFGLDPSNKADVAFELKIKEILTEYFQLAIGHKANFAKQPITRSSQEIVQLSLELLEQFEFSKKRKIIETARILGQGTRSPESNFFKLPDELVLKIAVYTHTPLHFFSAKKVMRISEENLSRVISPFQEVVTPLQK